MIQGLDHIAIAISDMKRSVDFYVRVLGLRIVDSRDPIVSPYFWVSFGVGQNLTLSLDPERTPNILGLRPDYPRTPHIAFNASEQTIAELKRRLEHEGIVVNDFRTEIYFEDPDGNSIEVTCWREVGLKDAGKNHW